MNSTPSERMWQWHRSSFVSAESLSGQVKENNIASFHDDCSRDSDLLLSRDARYVATDVFPDVGVSRFRGQLVNIPLRS